MQVADLQAQVPQRSDGYRLVWSDEFETDGAPDKGNWVFEEGFVRNNETQWYQKNNAVCRDGKLYITGREDIKRNPNYVKGSKDPKETKFIEFTSSSIMTRGLHRWTMGRFVMRAKIPHGEGMWPAFWALGENGEWPSSGEIDMMEYYQGKVLANVASGTATRWNARWDSEAVYVKDLGGEKWLNEFHIWRMDWDAKSIRLFLDDELINETQLADTKNENRQWGPGNPFHHPHYLILNLALGGDHGGDMEKAKLPADYVIDYVRVYQREEDRNFQPPDPYAPRRPYTGKKVGIRHFSELPRSVNKKCDWEDGGDSRCYAWTPRGNSRESAEMTAVYDDKVEGAVSYKFVLNHGWSRWLIEMNPSHGTGVADLSVYKKMGFAMKSSDPQNWDSFRIVIQSRDGQECELPLRSLGFKADGKWHRCVIDLGEVRKEGVDLKKISTVFSVAWGGVKSGQSFKLDDLYVE
jgi:beta-glucanase (GH16 family)